MVLPVQAGEAQSRNNFIINVHAQDRTGGPLSSADIHKLKLYNGQPPRELFFYKWYSWNLRNHTQEPHT